VEQLLFALLALTAIGGSVALISSRNPVHSAMFMVVVFVATAIMFLLLAAPFIAALQVIIYAGAIVVLFLFVISYLSLRGHGLFEAGKGVMGLGIGLAVLLAVELVAAVATLGGLGAAGGTEAGQAAFGLGGSSGEAPLGSVESVARALFSDYVVPFEITSVLLIVAMVGAVVLARRVAGDEPGASKPGTSEPDAGEPAGEGR
jgi:NADH-quinone oxidoreductase subunit J